MAYEELKPLQNIEEMWFGIKKQTDKQNREFVQFQKWVEEGISATVLCHGNATFWNYQRYTNVVLSWICD